MTPNHSSIQQTRSDFDRIAELPEPPWHIDDRIVRRLIRKIPPVAATCLEVGCGTGRVTQLLLEHVGFLRAVDLSERMIEQARRRCTKSNVQFETADIREVAIPEKSLDVIVTVATLHHIDLEWFFESCALWLRPGGVLLVLDLAPAKGWTALPQNIAGALYAHTASVVFNYRIMPSRQSRAAWAEHAKHDSFHSLAEIKHCACNLLPQAEIRRRFPWRYTLTWCAPMQSNGA